MIPVKALQDNDGHWYIIPNDEVSKFETLMLVADLTDGYEIFDKAFSKYRTGGDLNLKQLYIDGNVK